MCIAHDMTSHATTSDALSERLFQSTLGTLELFSIYLGKRLGLYTILAREGALNVDGLAEQAGIAPRYAREWLEQQAVAGFLLTDGDEPDADERLYVLPEKHAAVLEDADHPAHVAPFAQLLVAVGSTLPELVEAYRTGGGVPYARYGTDMREGIGAINRPAFLHELAGWIGSVPDVHERLSASERTARVADVGCGQGWSSIALAEAYPAAEVLGVDEDPASIDDARLRATERGSRARFVCANGDTLADQGPFDLALLLECLHDMPRPQDTLRSVRRALAPGGSVIIADERVAERFAPTDDPIERMMYGWSITHCLPVSMSEPGSRALGTVLRPSTVRALAEEAGYGLFEILPIENDLFRFYRLRA